MRLASLRCSRLYSVELAARVRILVGHETRHFDKKGCHPIIQGIVPEKNRCRLLKKGLQLDMVLLQLHVTVMFRELYLLAFRVIPSFSNNRHNRLNAQRVTVSWRCRRTAQEAVIATHRVMKGPKDKDVTQHRVSSRRP